MDGMVLMQSIAIALQILWQGTVCVYIYICMYVCMYVCDCDRVRFERQGGRVGT